MVRLVAAISALCVSLQAHESKELAVPELGEVKLFTFSVNAVGYVNKRISPGFNLIANPLNAADNSIGALFQNIQGGPVDGMVIYKLVNGQTFVSTQYDILAQAFIPINAASEVFIPGEGVYVYLPGTESKVVTFVGEVVQGLTSTPLPHGWSIKSSVVPQAVAPDALGEGSIPAANGDRLYVYHPEIRMFSSYLFDELDGKWTPPLPVIDVGQAFLYLRVGPSTNWVRSFSVNNPH